MADSEEEVLAKARRREAWIEFQRTADYRELLLERFEQFSVRNTFQPGQLVQWKNGLKNKVHPEYGVAVIVVEVLDPPIFDSTQETGTSYFREHLDIILGILEPADKELLLFHYDSRRFEAFKIPPTQFE